MTAHQGSPAKMGKDAEPPPPVTPVYAADGAFYNKRAVQDLADIAEFTELLEHVDTAKKEGREVEYNKWKPSEDAVRRGNRVVATECGLLQKRDEEAAAMAAGSEARRRKAEEEWNRANGEKRYSYAGDSGDEDYDYGELWERDRRKWGW